MSELGGQIRGQKLRDGLWQEGRQQNIEMCFVQTQPNIVSDGHRISVRGGGARIYMNKTFFWN